ncbi:MAG: DUF2889 domain-containing protein [Pseudomonadota bacterium]
MPLTTPASRTLAHTRETIFRGYHRDDGLWDIEATLVDRKTHEFHRTAEVVPAGGHTHDMAIRLTIDDDMTVVAAEAVMDAKPFGECEAGQAPFQKIVGARMGRGWRQAVEEAMGRDTGCTHLREMVSNMATAAFQTLPAYKKFLRRQAGEAQAEAGKEPAYFMGRCIGWAFDGPVVARFYPKFIGWAAKQRDKA